MGRDPFERYHPAAGFLFLGLALGCTVFSLDPLWLGISLACALAGCVLGEGWRAQLTRLKFLLPMTVLAAVVNGLFSGRGGTVLCRLPWGSPLTLESLLAGLSAAMLVGASLLWFACCRGALSPDRLLYLLGGSAPALCTVLMMALGFVPRFKAQFQTVREARQGLGRDAAQGTLAQRMTEAGVELSAMAGWALENAAETADSMKSRGYGLPGRTSFSLFRFRRRDGIAVGCLILCGLLLLWLRGSPWVYPVWAAFCLTPLWMWALPALGRRKRKKGGASCG